VRRAHRHDEEAWIEQSCEREQVLLVGADAVEQEEQRRAAAGRSGQHGGMDEVHPRRVSRRAPSREAGVASPPERI
jgi:hypothetical protein